MICCSASIEVECSSENTQLSPNPKDDGDTGGRWETQTREQKSTNQTDAKDPPSEEEGSLCLGTPMSGGSSSSKFNHLCLLQVSASNDVNSSSSENPLDAEGTRQNEELCDPNSTEEIADGLLFPNSGEVSDKQDAHCRGTLQSRVSESMDGALSNEEDLNSSHRNPKAQKYISVNLPLLEAVTSVGPGDKATVNERVSPQVSSKDSDSDYELCPEITLTYTEEFSDDDLEYLECSDVMTDYSNAVWQRNLEGTECVFLLESDDEEMEFSKYCWGECEPFLGEMGCGPRVSDNTGPMEASAGFCGDHSPSQEVRVRHGRTSTHNPPAPHTGMTLTLGSDQDGTSMVTDQGRYKLPTASAENDYPGIRGETRDSHQAGEEFASGCLLPMDKAVAERGVKRLSGELEESGMSPCVEMAAEKRVGGKDLWSKSSLEKPARVRRPGIKGKPRQWNHNLKDGVTEGTRNHLCPQGPVKHPLTPSDKKSSHAKADAHDLNSQFHTEGALPPQAEQDTKRPPTPPGALPQEVSSNLEGEGVQVNNLLETSWVPDQIDHTQVQIQETVGERLSLSRMPAFSEPARKKPAFPGTTTDSFPSLGGIDEGNAPLTQYLKTESCAQGPQPEENQDKENTPARSWEDRGHELNLPEASHAATSPCELSERLPQEGSSDSREPEALSANIVLTLGTVSHGPRVREAECPMEHLEAGDQGTRDSMESPVGASVHNCLPQGVCSMDFELAKGQINISDLCFPDDKTLDAVFQTQGSEPPHSAGKSNKGGNSAELPPPGNTLTWELSQNASEPDTGEHLAKVENSSSTGQERPSPSISGGLEERQHLSSEAHFVWGTGDDSPGASAPDSTDPPASPSSTVKFPREKPTTLTEDLERLQETLERGGTPMVTVATKAHPAKYLPVSMAEDSHADGPEESSPQAPGENSLQLPPNVRLGHTSNGSTTEPLEELCVAPRGPGVSVPAFPLPEGDFSSNSTLQIDTQSAETSQTVERVEQRSPEEDFQEKGCETTQRTQPESLPNQGSLSADNFQESWPLTSAAQVETDMVPLGHSSANSTEERRQSSGLRTSRSVVAETTVEDDGQAVSSVPPLSNSLLEEPKESVLGHWEACKEPKIIILEASVPEVWPPRRLTDSMCKVSEASAMTPDRNWAVGDVLKAGTVRPELDPSELAALASGPQAEAGPALANNRENPEGKGLARCTQWRCLSSQYLNQPRFLESSVDPVDEKGLCMTDLPPGASKTGGLEDVNNVTQVQEGNQLGMDHPAFFKQLLTCPKILESSVDPIDGIGAVEAARAETQDSSESMLGVSGEESKLSDGNLGQRVEVQPAISLVPCAQQSGETVPSENSTNQNQEAGEMGEVEQSQQDKAKVEVQAAILHVPCPDGSGHTVPGGRSGSQGQECREKSLGKAEQSEHDGGFLSPSLPLSSGPAVTTQAPVGVDTHTPGQVHDIPENHLVESECGKHVPSPSGLTQPPFTSSPKGNTTNFSISHKIDKPQSGETEPVIPSGSPGVTLAFVSGERASETDPKVLQDPCQLGPTLGLVRKSGEERPSPTAAKMGSTRVPASEEVKKKQETLGSASLAEGVKKKILSKVAALRLRLEEKEKARKNMSFPKNIPKLETSVSGTDEKIDPKKSSCKREGKAPVLLKKIQAEMFPDHSGTVRLSCQFAEIHEDSTILWTKDSQSIAQVNRSAGDTSTVSLTIIQASQKDQGLYSCCLKNSYGNVTAEFNLTPEVLKQLSSPQDVQGCEEIEFSQLIFKEDFLHDSYFGDRLRGQIATEELHFGEGVHRKAFRSKVLRGLLPVFQPGHACVLKVHNAVAYGTRNNEELIQRNYSLAAQECYVQNTARCYAKIYAAEAQPLEGFGEVPEIIPIFLIHRPENNIPYATVEEELIGEFVKYSIRDGKEINFLRRESEAGQKCCTFQHWVYQKTSGGLLVTDMQGVGMKLTDVGIATLAKGYKGFKGNCSMTFIDQFKALHQCNKYCKMLGLKSLQNNSQKQKKPSIIKSKSQPNATTVKKAVSGTPAEKKT